MARLILAAADFSCDTALNASVHHAAKRRAFQDRESYSQRSG
jgi:hypothetical protein